MKIDGNQIKVGNILEINSKLWRVLKTQHTQPGKGGAYLQVEMKEIREGTKMNERFRSSESVERAILDEKTCQYLYSESNKFVFMDNTTYEQWSSEGAIESAKRAENRARQMLAEYEAPAMDPAIDEALIAFKTKRMEELPNSEY